MTVTQLASVPPLTIGAGTRHQVGTLARGLAPEGAVVLLVADPGLAATGLIDDAAADLVAAGLKPERFTDIKSDPSLAQADAAASLAARRGARVVVALGGGSALDLGKTVAAIAGAQAPASTYALCAAPLPSAPLPVLCLPTTAGTGSETTRVAVLSGPDGAKLWFWGEELRCAHAILDPELTASLPPALTAATGLDALVHAVEAATNRRASAANDLYAHAAIALVSRHLERAVASPGDLVAREGLLRAAALAGTAIDNAGTAMGHAIGHALASLHPIHHGRAVTIAMLGSLPWVVGNDTEGRFAACAAAMGAPATASGFIDAFTTLVQRTGMDTCLDDAAHLTPEALAAQMDRPENRPMVGATARDVRPDDLLAMARAVLAVGAGR